jgi:hypothetical protein
MNHTLKTLAAAAAIALLSSGAMAQASAPAGANTPRIDQRQAHQEKRIDNGIASGALTKPEARRLERRQAAINRAEDKAKADGTVTGKERRHLTKMQNRASKGIRHQKHDRQHRKAATPGA